MHKRYWLIAFLFLGFLVPVFGQDSKPQSLKLKFEKDKTFYQEMTTETKQTMKVNGTDIVQNQTQTFFFSWTPIKQEGDSWVLKQKIEGVKMRIEIGNTPIEFDSTKAGSASGPLSDFFKALVGAEFQLTFDKDMKVTKIEGREEFLKKLTGANPQMKTLLDQILSERALKQMADPTFAAVPGKEVKPNDSWTRDSSLDMGPIGKYQTTYKYTYEGKGKDKDSKLDRIKVDTTLKYEPPGDAAVSGGLPFKIKSADLKSSNAGGTISFDPAVGRITESNMHVKLDGTLTIEIGGQSTKVDLSQTQETKVKTLDTNPLMSKK